MTENQIRAIVRAELRRIVATATAAPVLAPEPDLEGDPIEAWVRALPAGTTGRACEWLPLFLAEHPERRRGPDALTAQSFGIRVRMHCGRLVSRRLDRTNRMIYTREPDPSPAVQP